MRFAPKRWRRVQLRRLGVGSGVELPLDRRVGSGRQARILVLMLVLLNAGCQCRECPQGHGDAGRTLDAPSVVFLGPNQMPFSNATLRAAWRLRHQGRRIAAEPEIVTSEGGRVASSVIQRLADTDAWLLPAADGAEPRFAPVRLRDALAVSSGRIQLAAEGEFTGLVKGGPSGHRRIVFSPYRLFVRADGRQYDDKQVVVVDRDDTFRGPTVADPRVPVYGSMYWVPTGSAPEPRLLGRLDGPIPPGCQIVINLGGPAIESVRVSARRPDGTPLLLAIDSIRQVGDRKVHARAGSGCSDASFWTNDPVTGFTDPAYRIRIQDIALRRRYLLRGYVSEDATMATVDQAEFRKKSDPFHQSVVFQEGDLELVVPAQTR